MENWKKISKYPLYEVSDLGRIKTYNWKNKGKESIMKPALDNGGYLRTMLKNPNGKFSTIKVHRIVAIEFIPNPNNLPEVNHKNGIKNDNRVCNLEWVTHSENLIHCYKIGLKNNRGQNNPCASLTDEQVREIRANYQYGKKRKNGETKQDIANRYNTTFAVIKRIIHKKTWKHLL